ncbi:helix-turn-helix domain-containing protein [Isobaculum melis]|uniref:Helix-turn-helix domain-containing protein n=1 Tax=Isobaculum melis TaxID=142588 RepID=A0A1H9U722_9LACT|nr:helix-turn-helix domain-containing protein [Isobaculum melis]SES05276.1 Helix-turn-helix domain-containing protein [Isobaculum melis]
MSNKRYSYEEKKRSIQHILSGKECVTSEARRVGAGYDTVNTWLRKYRENGLNGLKISKNWKKYLKQDKTKAVEYALSGKYSKHEIVQIFKISSKSLLDKWISTYTKGKRLKSTSKGISQMKTNKSIFTTGEERLEIVQFTIAHKLDYQLAMEKYGVSYQQVYSWVKKYQKNGTEALRDGRGRKKDPKELTEEERLKQRIKELELRNEELEMEKAIAKKLQEIQERFNPSH